MNVNSGFFFPFLFVCFFFFLIKTFFQSQRRLITVKYLFKHQKVSLVGDKVLHSGASSLPAGGNLCFRAQDSAQLIRSLHWTGGRSRTRNNSAKKDSTPSFCHPAQTYRPHALPIWHGLITTSTPCEQAKVRLIRK